MFFFILFWGGFMNFWTFWIFLDFFDFFRFVVWIFRILWIFLDFWIFSGLFLFLFFGLIWIFGFFEIFWIFLDLKKRFFQVFLGFFSKLLVLLLKVTNVTILDTKKCINISRKFKLWKTVQIYPRKMPSNKYWWIHKSW